MLKDFFNGPRLTDTILAALISYGGFSTFFPKFVNGLGTLNGTSEFETLTWFGIGYFLLPPFLFLGYWNIKGYRIVIKDKLNVKDSTLILSNEVAFLFLALKIIPILIFFSDKYFFYRFSQILIVIYFLIGLLEFWWYSGATKKIISEISSEKNLSKNKIYLEMLHYGVLISFLNLFLGFGMLYFTEPWYLYKDGMIVVLWMYLIAYACLVYSIYLFRICKISPQKSGSRFFVIPLFFFLALIYFLPHVNRSLTVFDLKTCGKCSEIEIETFVFLGVTVLIVFLKFLIHFIYYLIFRDKKFPFSSISYRGMLYGFLLLSLFCALPFAAKNALDNKSKNYFDKRLKAVNEITDKKLIPHFSAVDSISSKDYGELLRFVHRNNHFLRMYGNWNHDTLSYNKLFSEIEPSVEYNRYTDICQRDLIVNYFSQFSKAREFFYGKYTEMKDYDSDFALNDSAVSDFYSNLFVFLKDTVFSQTIIPLSQDESLKDISGYYTHPLNYYSYVVNHYRDQVSKVDSVIHNLKYIQYLNRIDSKSGEDMQILESLTTSNRKLELVAKIQKTKNGIVEFMNQKAPISDSKLLDALPIEAFETLRDIKQEQFYDRIRSAQIIYQSYLYDYQRIGVFLFLLQLVVLGFAWYKVKEDYYVLAQEDNTIDPKSKADDHEIAIAFVVVLALLFPLLREIKAENIDPQKKFWMLNLSNWYAPGFILPELPPLEKEIEKEKRKEFYGQVDSFNVFQIGRSVENNSDSDTSLVEAVKNLNSILEQLKKEGINVKSSVLDDINETTRR